MINTATQTHTHTLATEGNLTEAEGRTRNLTLLPALYKNEIEMATHREQIESMQMIMQPEHLGRHFIYNRLGFVIQYVGEGLMRCTQATNDERSLLWLSMYTETVHASGGWVQLAPYTVFVEPELFAEQHTVVMNEAAQRVPFTTESRHKPLTGMEVA